MILSDWFVNVKDPDEKRQIIEILQNEFLRTNFLAIIDRLEASLDRQELGITAYDSPSWSHRQAHINGNREAYARIRALFTLKDSKTNG